MDVLNQNLYRLLPYIKPQNHKPTTLSTDYCQGKATKSVVAFFLKIGHACKHNMIGNKYKRLSIYSSSYISCFTGAQWLSGRVLDSRPRGRGFEPHRGQFVVTLSKNINPSLVLVQPRKTRPFISERLLMGRKESNQTNKQNILFYL